MRRKAAKFDLQIHAERGERYAQFLRIQLAAAHRLLRPALSHLSIALVGSARMRRLHKVFLADGTLTDVLTFPLEFDARGQTLGGEIVICPAVALQQARHRRTPVRNELLLYALHGMLHLCGFDDKTLAGFEKMHVKEDEILTQLGVGPVFRASPRSIRKRSRGKS
ncbi:MAG: rRNA maturation RNase YbeY [Tepidisphaeraceae bacterium]